VTKRIVYIAVQARLESRMAGEPSLTGMASFGGAGNAMVGLLQRCNGMHVPACECDRKALWLESLEAFGGASAMVGVRGLHV
jgi:hypothetical protein